MINRLLVCTLLLGFISIAWIQKSDHQPEPEPQPIKTVMQRLMMDMHTVTLGIYLENYETIYSGAHAVASHPKIIMEQRKEIAGILGNQMKSFAAFDMVVHHHSDSLAMAAKNRDMQNILRHYQIVQKGCISCHATFRDKIKEASSNF
jgi:hypothetical protein